jgi:RNA polymerase sigma-70 factor (ECF subfamily)
MQTKRPASTRVEEAYREEGDRLYYALLAFTRNPEIAREAVSEAFARAITSADSIRELTPWLWRVAFRLATEDLKQRAQLVSANEVEDHAAPEPEDLFESLGRLSDRQRASIVLHYYAGYSLDEIALILGTKRGTIGVHLYRGRARLRHLLEEDDDD